MVSVSSHVAVVNTHNKILTAKRLKQDNRDRKLRKAFSKLYFDLMCVLQKRFMICQGDLGYVLKYVLWQILRLHLKIELMTRSQIMI